VAARLVSGDDGQERRIGSGEWHALTWSRDGRSLLGLVTEDGRRLELVALTETSGEQSTVADFGRAPTSFAYAVAIGMRPVQGLTLSRDGSHGPVFSARRSE
jgi:hypothetical protein